MRRVLVAGATGYLGRFVAREFKARGDFVRVLVRSPQKLGSLAGEVDEVVQGEITRRETLAGVCSGMEVVFSSVGITKQRDGLTFTEVDYGGNLNLLLEARKAGAEKFVYVSVYRASSLLHLAIVKAHEDFVTALRASGMDYSVVRPTGFFSDMEDYLKMALKGQVFLFGSGQNRINPIHGADLAKTCADAAEPERREVNVGGPEILTHRQIAELALRAAGNGGRITSLPLWLLKPVVRLVKAFDRRQGELLAFLTTAMAMDAVAPLTGLHRLEDHFDSLAVSGKPTRA